jgi:hypothetical protein
VTATRTYSQASEQQALLASLRTMVKSAKANGRQVKVGEGSDTAPPTDSPMDFKDPVQKDLPGEPGSAGAAFEKDLKENYDHQTPQDTPNTTGGNAAEPLKVTQDAFDSDHVPSDISSTKEESVHKPEDLTPPTDSPMDPGKAASAKIDLDVEGLADHELRTKLGEACDRLYFMITETFGVAPEVTKTAADKKQPAPDANQVKAGAQAAEAVAEGQVHPIARDAYFLGKQAGHKAAGWIRKIAEGEMPPEMAGMMPPPGGDPMAGGGSAPPMDPAMMGGGDPAAMGGAPGGDPMAGGGGAGGGGDIEKLRQFLVEAQIVPAEAAAAMSPEELVSVLVQALTAAGGGGGGAPGGAPGGDPMAGGGAPPGAEGPPGGGEGGGEEHPPDTEEGAEEEKSASIRPDVGEHYAQALLNQNKTPEYLEKVAEVLDEKITSGAVPSQHLADARAIMKLAYSVADHVRGMKRRGEWNRRDPRTPKEAAERAKIGEYLKDIGVYAHGN